MREPGRSVRRFLKKNRPAWVPKFKMSAGEAIDLIHQAQGVAVLAHPDDESFGPGGTLALYAHRGAEVHLACATRGVVGTVAEELLHGYRDIADLREHELRCAAQHLRLAGVHFMGYRDSGMPGSPDNLHPQSLAAAPLDEVAARVTHLLRSLRPQVVVTFDPIGGYRHPDHIAIQRATVAAFDAAGDSARYPDGLPAYRPQKVYFHTFGRRFLRFQGAIVSDGKKRVMIGIPMHKGEVSASTMMSVTLAQSQILEVNFHLLGLSLLAKNFNLLFIEALKARCDYFLLHHSDLGVQGCRTNFSGSWVDLLGDRLNENELVALSVVVPIKSRQGFTSSGLEMVKNDPWSLRRLTIMESESLPLEYINRADLCELFKVSEEEAGALLINSGCMLMDIRNGGGDYSKLQWPGFNIVDFIAWNKQGVPSSYTVPEDWNFSNWLHDNELPYACTRELVVAHIGQENYMNLGTYDEKVSLTGWGEPSDVNRQQQHPDVWRGVRE